MFRILTLNDISVAGLRRLPREQYAVSSETLDPHAILVRSYDMRETALPASLLAVARAGAGVNNIPVPRCGRGGVPVFNTPGANANAVKELVLAGLLMAARNLPQAWRFVRDLESGDGGLAERLEAGKKQFAGFELPGRTLGVVGLGAIGVEVANAAASLGMRVVGYDPEITVRRAWQLSSSVEQAATLDALLARSDAVTVHIPLFAGTRHLLNAGRLGLMPRGAVLINMARSEVVDEHDVLQLLDAGSLHAYVTDFPSSLLKQHARVISLPHLGASTREAEDNCAVMAAGSLREYLEEGNIRNSVNFPETAMPRNGRCRLAVANANVPNMVGRISTALAQAGINIADLLNQSRGELAYTIADLDGEVSEQTLRAVRSIGGVLKARVIPGGVASEEA